MNVDGVKISSSDILNKQLISKSLKIFKKVFLTISGLELNEIKKLLKYHKNKSKIILLYGIQSEPTKIEDNNFNKLKKLKEIFYDYKFGVMEHTDGENRLAKYIPLIPMSFGINFIEKHLTTNRAEKLEDYISALSIKDFKDFTNLIRTCWKSLGSENLKLSKKKIKYKNSSQKVIVAMKNLDKGEILKENTLSLKRNKQFKNKNNLFDINLVKNKILINKKNKDDPIYKKDIK